MSVRAAAAFTVPPPLWDDTDMIDALAARDIAQVFRLVQRVTRASQTHLGVATGLSQAQVSEIISGTRRVSSIDVLIRICSGLAMPGHARMTLLLGEHPSQATSRPAGNGGNRTRATTAQAERAAGSRPVNEGIRERYADVTAIYSSRSEFTAKLPPHVLFDDAKDIRAAGLSLNILCQQYADNQLLKLLAAGAHLRCMFLDPAGEAIRRQEREDDYPDGHLSALTELNIQNLAGRIRNRLPADARERLAIRVYDETIRANVLLIDDRLCIIQPYLPQMRGVDSPTMVVERNSLTPGLYPVYDGMFTSLWERSRDL
ncbi:helix-turn-helix transcriptional regulator [Micromonospora sp. PSH03]|nr:helix-turn-helix transcriptional regulator [Micromonospora salmantinae]